MTGRIQFFVEVEDGAEWVRWTVSSRVRRLCWALCSTRRACLLGNTRSDLSDLDSEAVINTPVTVDLSLTVRDDELVVYPAEIVVPLHDCSEGAGAVQVQVAIDGTPGTGYTLQLEDDPAWVSVDALSGSVPGSATLTITPAAVEFRWRRRCVTARRDF